MKKNKTMRAAGALFVVTMLSTSIVSGTYAKYVTGNSGSDSARVAKFGVVVTAEGSLFDHTYKAANDNTPGGKTPDSTPFTSLTVESDTNVAAPGTKNDTGLKFTITGTPEVDVKIQFSVADDSKDIFLGAKDNLPDMTTGDKTDSFDNESDYYPIVYTLSGNILKNVDLTGTNVDLTAKADGKISGSLAQIEAVFTKLNGAAGGIYVDAGTDLSEVVGDLTLTWKWDFDDSGKGTYDKQDTLLGDIASYWNGDTSVFDGEYNDCTFVVKNRGTDYSIETSASVTVTVTQAD